MSAWQNLLACLPHPPEFVYDFDALAHTPVGPHLCAMAGTQQNPAFHGEGDVLTHTVMVCSQLCQLEAFRTLDAPQRIALSVAALLHDAGKPRTTRLEDGVFSSPGHSITGTHIVRKLLWQEFGLCGSPEKLQLREAICLLIRHHMFPVHALEQEQPERRLALIAAGAQLVPCFSLHLLSLLAKADVLGRIAADMQESLSAVELFSQLAEESGCLHSPLGFSSTHAQYAYLSGRNVLPDQPLFDDSWGEVILLSGLPGTGKDTWIRQNHPDLPMVSMDDLRRTMGIKPTDDQGRVAQAAQEACRVHLRAKQPFIFNTTSLTPMMRSKSVRLFESYNARVRIVYLETDWAEQLRRNAARTAVVPESAIDRMLDTLIPPERHEAQRVEWLCV
ncbi:MAG: AAA family ATPase [Clostridia bacterium]|nr:AAA family ATPase [Clostridia bacterium]